MRHLESSLALRILPAKIERCHRSMKNAVALERHYNPRDLERVDENARGLVEPLLLAPLLGRLDDKEAVWG